MGQEVKDAEALLLSSLDADLLKGLLRRVLEQMGATIFRPAIGGRRNGNGKVRYPEAEALFGAGGDDAFRLLELLTSMGVLRRTLLEVVKSCPSCGSTSIEVKEKCPSCGSEITLQFMEGASYACPSCGGRVDGDTVYLSCRRCGSSFTTHSARDQPLYMYILVSPDEAADRGLREPSGGRGASQARLTSEMVKIVEAFAERLNKILDEYFKARPMYRVSQETSIEQRPGAPQIQLAPHLAKTYQVVRSKGQVTAMDVSMVTGRSRPLESVYLNQLVALGLLSKRRVGRRLYFSPSRQ